VVSWTPPPVLVTRRLPQEALDRIAARCDMTLYDGEGAMPRDQLLAQLAGKAGAITLLTDRVDEEFLEAAGPRLKVVANYAVGFDNIDVQACTRHGVLACNTPEVLTETTADTAFALMMAAARRVAEGDRFLRSGARWIWGPLMMLGQDVHHATIGIVGFGRIGQALARRARGRHRHRRGPGPRARAVPGEGRRGASSRACGIGTRDSRGGWIRCSRR